MFSQLIRTRCRQGIEILDGGRSVVKDGFKVYSCSENIINGDIADMPFLDNVAGQAQSFADPVITKSIEKSLMDDAYLYLTPDKGKRMMVDFHPVPYDMSATGDYAHRSGNFINQIYIGDFGDFYTYELFGSSHAWDAKAHDEAYFYEVPPQPLPMRDDLDALPGSIVMDDVAAFVADGRREAVASAVAFLLEQFSRPAEERKYLVIQDENSAKLELWVAAIQSAFSPRMSSGLSYATRMEKFNSANKYTVNLNGQFQTQINLMDPNQKLRFRAMIVGVDERDSINSSQVRRQVNLPYVVLSGKNKTPLGETDTTHPYYKLITSYSDRHVRFCRDYLQMLDISEPREDVLKLSEAFLILDGISERSTVEEIASALAILNRYELKLNGYLKALYESIKSRLKLYLQSNLTSTFAIMSWLRKAAELVGDTEAAMSFNSIVNETFAERLFNAPRSTDTSAFWRGICSSAFFDTVADNVTDTGVIEKYKDRICAFGPDSWVCFMDIYLSCAQRARRYSVNGLVSVVGCALQVCCNARDIQNGTKIAAMVERYGQGTVKPLLIRVSQGKEPIFTNFCMAALAQTIPELVSDDARNIQLCKELLSQGRKQACAAMLHQRAKRLLKPDEQEKFVSSVLRERAFDGLDLTFIFKAVDGNISLSDKGSAKVAFLLQRELPANAVCVNSAHICALAAIDDRKRKERIDHLWKELERQGFPSVEDKVFAGKLVDRILTLKLDRDEIIYVIELFSNSVFYLKQLVAGILSTTPRDSFYWNMLLYTMVKNKSTIIKELIVSECLAARQPQRLLAQLGKAISEPSLTRYFDAVADMVEERLSQDEPKSKMSKLFNSLFGDFSRDK